MLVHPLPPCRIVDRKHCAVALLFGQAGQELLRRNANRPAAELSLGNLRLDPGRRTATCGGKPLSLTAREFTILESLLRRPGGVLSREEILEQAWGEREEPMSNTIDVLIGRLRRKIDLPGQASRIETVRGMGYRLR